MLGKMSAFNLEKILDQRSLVVVRVPPVVLEAFRGGMMSGRQ